MLHFIKFIYNSFKDALHSALSITGLVGMWLCIPTIIAAIFFSSFIALCYITLFLATFVLMLIVNLTSEKE